MSLRTGLQLQALSARLPSLASASRSRWASTYQPAGVLDAEPLPRPPRPESPFFYTGKPQLNDTLAGLHKVLDKAERALRDEYIWPLPSGFPRPPQLEVMWRAPAELGTQKQADLNRLSGVLSKLGYMRQVAAMAGSYDIAEKIDKATKPFVSAEKAQELELRRAKKNKEAQQKTDEFGRAYGLGKRKESSARVWLVPSAAGQQYLESSPETADESKEIPIPTSEVLINHLPLPIHFGRPIDRDAVLRPLRVTGLLGAFNIFALVRGGGTSGQSQAIAMAVAHALVRLRPETRDTLRNDNALYRDPRVVERKHTNLVKARKAVSFVCGVADISVLGSSVNYLHLHIYHWPCGPITDTH